MRQPAVTMGQILRGAGRHIKRRIGKEKSIMKLKGAGIFALGTLFGMEGIRLLTSRDAKKVYAHCTAGVLRMRDCLLEQATVLQENCEDIYEEAKAINEERDREEAVRYEKEEDTKAQKAENTADRKEEDIK